HTYHVQPLGDGRCRFGSWEQAMGWGFRIIRRFWIAHFTFVKDESLIGARRLETIYKQSGSISEAGIRGASYLKKGIGGIGRVGAVGALIAGGWFYIRYLRLEHYDLAPNVHAVLSAGGNSIIVRDGVETLLIDPKFPPGSSWLRRWMAGHGGPPT